MDDFALFATPVVAFTLDGMDAHNRDLCQRLVDERRHSPGRERSNVGGWHSPPDLAQRPEPCYQALFRAIVDQVAGHVARLAERAGLSAPRYRYGLHAWAMVMGDGDYTILHDHGDAHWSCVYYVDAGDADASAHPQSGLLAFVDPRRGGRPIPALDLFPSTFTVTPRTGQLVVFPGWLQHYVHSYRGARPRVSISANVVMEPTPR
jgi:uncharacterized protein (TIGR02466 family)